MLFKLNLQLFASKKGVGSTKNGRDSAGRCHAGSIIYRQRGTRIYPGVNTKKGKDDTIFATCNGVVKYERSGKDRTVVKVVPQE